MLVRVRGWQPLVRNGFRYPKGFLGIRRGDAGREAWMSDVGMMFTSYAVEIGEMGKGLWI
jgi:hypothetical protein